MGICMSPMEGGVCDWKFTRGKCFQCFEFLFYVSIFSLFFILLYIYENTCVVFLGFGLSIISHILCPLLDHGLRMKYRVHVRP